MYARQDYDIFALDPRASADPARDATGWWKNTARRFAVGSAGTTCIAAAVDSRIQLWTP
jgi:hypothetical protein